MKIIKDQALKELNAFKLDVFAKEFLTIDCMETFEDTIELMTNSKRKMVIGDATNILFLNDFDGLIIKNELKGIKTLSEKEETIYLEVASGEIWDDVVQYAVHEGYGGGIENLAFIPGRVGSAVVQNIGAYGVELKDILKSVKAYSFKEKRYIEWTREALNFGYRTSFFKESKDEYFIVSAVFSLKNKPKRFILNYGGVKSHLNHEVELTPKVIYETIRKIREAKLPDHQTIGNCGSFFKNPVIKDTLFNILKSQYPNIPHYPLQDGGIKIPAAWLIETAGLKGYSIGGAKVYDQHALILTNHNTATPQDIEALAQKIIDEVYSLFKIKLHPEVIFVR